MIIFTPKTFTARRATSGLGPRTVIFRRNGDFYSQNGHCAPRSGRFDSQNYRRNGAPEIFTLRLAVAPRAMENFASKTAIVNGAVVILALKTAAARGAMTIFTVGMSIAGQ